MEVTRRRLLSGVAGAVGAGMLAGCLGDGSTGSDSGETVAQASFFVFGNIGAHVAGETAAADLLVPIGQHGHGWEPGPGVREDIRDADLFVHGMTGFQPWVDDIRGDLEADDTGVTTVDVSAGIDLLEPGGGHGHDHGGDEHDGEGGEGDHDHEGDEHGGEGEEGDHDGEGGNDDRGSGMDPHFWMDPLRVSEAVSTVRQRFVDVDPDRADAYAENAEAFQDDLEELHEQIEGIVDDAAKDIILVAGHDSFQYFGDRYGVEVQALTDVSPDDRPTLQDIERAQEIVDTHDLQYICADPLEPQQAAEQLRAETSVEEILPLTAMPGLTDEWESEGWGYVEIMENVNLPTLERALGA